MTINLCRTTSRKNKVNKSIVTVKTLNGKLKNQTNVTGITIQISGIADIINEINYLHIPEFNRYYFLNDFKILSNEIVEIRGHVDVLQSYHTLINQLKVTAERSTNKVNRYLPDAQIVKNADTFIIGKPFPNAMYDECFILALAGSQPD